MSAKKVISFLIASTSILVASLIITFAVILPTRTVPLPDSIKSYAFCFNESNDATITQISNTRLKLSQNVEFKPSMATTWQDGFMTFKGATVADGVEFSNTLYSEYVCAIPFSIFNNHSRDILFKLNVELSGDETLANAIEFKIYDYFDKSYKTMEEINGIVGSGKYEINNRPYNELLQTQTANYCLVAIASKEKSQSVNFNADTAFININISVSMI